MVPDKLIRAFSQLEYAQDFINGNIRFSTLQYYKNIEDRERVDAAEGRAEIHINGEQLIVDQVQNTMNSRPGIEVLRVDAQAQERFICCLSEPENTDYNYLRRFGNYCVLIEEPKLFIQDIGKSIGADKQLRKNQPYLEYGSIRYDKGEHTDEVLDEQASRRLSWLQKPRKYQSEREFRLCFWFSFVELIGSPENFTVVTGFPLKYCKIISVDS